MKKVKKNHNHPVLILYQKGQMFSIIKDKYKINSKVLCLFKIKIIFSIFKRKILLFKIDNKYKINKQNNPFIISKILMKII